MYNLLVQNSISKMYENTQKHNLLWNNEIKMYIVVQKSKTLKNIIGKDKQFKRYIYIYILFFSMTSKYVKLTF